jgi:sulfur relay (sulfurtransferase) complex TusBCD TusD component (DsrE family)
VKFLVIVNDAPWSDGLGLVAWRFARAVVRGPHELAAVYFREEGVYTTLRGTVREAGAVDLYVAWQDLSRVSGAPLLLCSTDARRRLDDSPAPEFREAGLPEIVSLMKDCDRVISL